MRDAGPMWASNAVAIAGGLVQTAWVGRVLGPTGYGVFQLILVWPSIVYTLFEARSTEAGMKYLGEYDEVDDHRRALAFTKLGYLLDSGIGLLSLLIIAAATSLFGSQMLESTGNNNLAIMYAASLVAAAWGSTSRAVLATRGMFGTIAWASVGHTVVRVGLVVGLVESGRGVAGAVTGMAVAGAASGVAWLLIATVTARRAWDGRWWATRLNHLSDRASEIRGFIWYANLESMLAVVVKRLDIALVGLLSSATDVGYYSIAKSAASAVANIASPLQTVVFPRLSTTLARTGDSDHVIEQSRNYVLWLGAPLGVLGLASLPFAETALRLFVGSAFVDATITLQLLGARAMIVLALFPLRPTIYVLNLVKYWTINRAGMAAASVAGIFLAVPRLGHVGAALQDIVVITSAYAAASIYLLSKQRRTAN